MELYQGDWMVIELAGHLHTLPENEIHFEVDCPCNPDISLHPNFSMTINHKSFQNEAYLDAIFDKANVY